MSLAVTHDLGAVVRPINLTASSIEAAFLKAGDGLGRGLAIFEQLGASLSALSGELDGGAVAVATGSIGRVADELVSFSEHLPRDSATLAGVHDASKTVSGGLGRLLENLRMMTVLTRSARIEAVAFDAHEADFAHFTHDIAQLTRHVQDKVETCAREHARLIKMLGAASHAQTALERDYRAKLVELSGELTATLATIEERRRRSTDVARDLVVRSDQIAGAVRTAIMSLQSGDSTRQRLEHVLQGLELTRIPPAASDCDARAVQVVMYRLQSSQLRDTIEAFDGDVEAIDGSLHRLVEDARDLVALGQSVYGGDGSDGSFLQTFGERLSRASDFIQRCAGARDGVGSTVASMRVLLDELHATISDLNGVIMDVVLIGINAGLKAARLGNAGRGLVVIAQELKNTAGSIAVDAKTLLPVFDDLQALSRQLDVAAASAGADRDVDADVASILGALGAGGDRMSSFLSTLGRVGRTFQDEVVSARQDFARVGETRAGLLDAADDIEAWEQDVETSGIDCELGLPIVDQMMMSRYTMARERDIHVAVLGSRTQRDDAVTVSAEDELAELLF